MKKISLLLSAILIGCGESTTEISTPEFSVESMSRHPFYVRDTTWVELNSGMSLDWVFPQSMKQQNNPWNYKIVSDSSEAIRYGWKSERFELRKGDCLFEDCYRQHRNERRLRHQEPSEIKLDVEYWYGWSIYVPELDPAGNSFLFFGQVQQEHSNEPLWMFIKNGRDPFCMMRLPTRWNSFRCDSDTDIALVDHEDFTGRWHDIVMNVKFHETDGFMKIWINGEQKGEFYGSTITRGNEFVTFGYGLYRPSRTVTVVAYFDEVRWGFTREQVDIRFIETQRER